MLLRCDGARRLDATLPSASTSRLVSPGASSSLPVLLGRGTVCSEKQLVADDGFAVGSTVEYCSVTHGKWIQASVRSHNADGTYDLDCKPSVAISRIRSANACARHLAYRAGSHVEYFSESLSMWIPAKVLRVSAVGTFDLDCEPDVPATRLRRPMCPQRPCDGPTETASVEEQMLHSRTKRRSLLETFNLSGRCCPQTYPELDSEASPRAAAPDYDGPSQLVRRRRRSDGTFGYEVCAEGARLLERHGARRISTVALSSPSSTGRSCLAKMLLGPGSDEWSDIYSRGGLSLWVTADTEDIHSPVVAFLDCAGELNEDVGRVLDVEQFVLSIMLASVVVLSSQGVLESSVFDKMSALRECAYRYDSHMASGKATLCWVLRDFSAELRDTRGMPMLPEEYLENALDQSAIGQNMSQWFSERRCFTLPTPLQEAKKLHADTSGSVQSFRLASELSVGVDALRFHVLASAHARPKIVGSDVLDCSSFVALVRHLVAGLNANDLVSLPVAWHELQHSACSKLVAELREQVVRELSNLSIGGTLLGGARLPMPESSLHAVLRDQRRKLKSAWTDRAVGGEATRRTYWKDLKESIVSEQAAILQQNMRLADRRVTEGLQLWSAWLDGDSEAMTEKRDGDNCEAAAALVDRLDIATQAHFARGVRVAMESCARHINSARASVAATLEQSITEQRAAVSWGQHAARRQANIQQELESTRMACRDTSSQLDVTIKSEQSKHSALDRVIEELQVAKSSLRAVEVDMEVVRSQERDARAERVFKEESLDALLSEVADARAGVHSAEAERDAVHFSMGLQKRELASETATLEDDLRHSRTRCLQTSDAISKLRERRSEERSRLQQEHASALGALHRQHAAERLLLEEGHARLWDQHHRAAGEARQRLEQQRSMVLWVVGDRKEHYFTREREIGVLEGKFEALSMQQAAMRAREAELVTCIRACEHDALARETEIRELEEELRRASEQSSRIAEQGEEQLQEAAEHFTCGREAAAAAPKRQSRWRLPGVIRRSADLRGEGSETEPTRNRIRVCGFPGGTATSPVAMAAG